ncbi:MAG: putative sulfoacetate--CoA ligase [Syntrophorhabdaceae bacterium PtaU1.Bin034]|jgi:acyl-coenzyme A synthetase/AMP-(fatty) acid ligase|nr:MAG: putative sulfoacetate--CoA ligase [Syntrophorhabdaceae bacterium PtaU1.Bin034]
MDSKTTKYKSWHDMIEDNARTLGDKVFIEALDDGSRISFREMNEWCNRVANFLKQKNLTKDDKVTIIGKNSIETMIIYFGTLKYGAILNPVFSEESLENLYRIVNLAQPSIVLFEKDMNLDKSKRLESEWISFTDFYSRNSTDSEFFALVKDQPVTFDDHLGDGNDMGIIVYTSGTTELPKGILIPRDGLFCMVDEISERTGITQNDRVLEYRAYNWLSSQLLTILTSMMRGNTLFFARKFSRSKFPDWVKNHNITVSSGVPAVFSMLVNQPVELKKSDVPSLRFMTSSSAPLPVETHLKFEEMYGIPINQMMGMSEAGWMVGNPPGNRKIGSVGPVLKHKEVFFVKDTGDRCGPGETGEMVVRGRAMGKCYLRGDGTIDEFPAEGFRTGDLGHMDKDGYVYITGRKKDLIIRGGINISPLEITSRLLEHPNVAEAVTLGAPDKIYGEEVVSFVVKKNEDALDESEIIRHCRNSLPDFKVPKRVFFVSEIPKGERGKVAKKDLMKMLEDLLAQA